jgi:hypothetical protein
MEGISHLFGKFGIPGGHSDVAVGRDYMLGI